MLCFGCREHLLLGSHCSASALGAARPSEPFFAVPFGELQLPGGAQSSMASRARCDSVPRGQVLLGSLRPLPWGAGSGATPSLCQPLTSRPPAAGVLGENQFICCFLPITCLRGTDTSCAKPSACGGAGAAPAAVLIRFYARGAGLAGRLPALSSPALRSWRSSGMFVLKPWGPSLLGRMAREPQVGVRSCRAGSGAGEGRVCIPGVWGGCSAFVLCGEGGLQPHTSASRCLPARTSASPRGAAGTQITAEAEQQSQYAAGRLLCLLGSWGVN